MSKIYSYLKQILLYLVLIVYIFLLAKILLFKYVSPFELFSVERIATRTYNLIPFKSIYEYLFSTHLAIIFALTNVVGNIIIFIPLGMYLQVFKRNKKIFDCITLTCVISLCVEVTQYILGIGAFDIDDIILNTVGGLLGIIIYRIVYSIFKNEFKTRNAITFFFCMIAICCFAFMRFSGLRFRI